MPWDRRASARVRLFPRLASRRRPISREAGVALVEFSVILPVAMLLLTGCIEFGFAFNHNLTLEYATREGARIGTALGNGAGTTVACGDVDAEVVAGVERVLVAPGSPVSLARVSRISIWKADDTGQPVAGAVNSWTYTGPRTGPTVHGDQLAFTPGTDEWPACSRTFGPPADSVGVSLSYTYKLVGPMASIMAFFGGPGAATLPMTDQTVMAINPSE